MTENEIKKRLIDAGWDMSLWLRSETQAKSFYKDMSTIFTPKLEGDINYKDHMVEYARQRGLI